VPRFQPQRFEQILTKMIARVVARTDLSDVADSSTVKHLLAASARADDEQYYQMTLLLQLFSIDSATGDDLDERAKDIQPSIMQRRAASKAAGTVIFTRAGTSGSVIIPLGTKVKTAGGVIFTTTALGSITPASSEQISGHGIGRDSAEVSVIADQPGSTGRVAGATIIKFVSKPAGVDEVTNPSAFSVGGLDKESDDDFRNRLKQFISGLARSTVGALESGVIGAQDPTSGATILFSKAVEDLVTLGRVVLYIDDGLGTAESTAEITGENVTEGLSGPPVNSAVGGEETLFLNNKPIKTSVTFTLTSSSRGALVQNTHYTVNQASGQIQFDPALVATEVITADYTYYTGVIQLAQKIVDGDPDDRANYPGLRAAGVLVIVAIPQVLLQNVAATVVIKEGYDQDEVRTAVEQAIKDYINSLSISGDVIRNELIKRIMEVTGVFNINLTTPATDIILLDDQLPRTTDANITVS
jgi:uncharacterized phage protein gp47/JayE